jgi:hypothetical protein
LFLNQSTGKMQNAGTLGTKAAVRVPGGCIPAPWCAPLPKFIVEQGSHLDSNVRTSASSLLVVGANFCAAANRQRALQHGLNSDFFPIPRWSNFGRLNFENWEYLRINDEVWQRSSLAAEGLAVGHCPAGSDV